MPLSIGFVSILVVGRGIALLQQVPKPVHTIDVRVYRKESNRLDIGTQIDIANKVYEKAGIQFRVVADGGEPIDFDSDLDTVDAKRPNRVDLIASRNPGKISLFLVSRIINSPEAHGFARLARYSNGRTYGYVVLASQGYGDMAAHEFGHVLLGHLGLPDDSEKKNTPDPPELKTNHQNDLTNIMGRVERQRISSPSQIEVWKVGQLTRQQVDAMRRSPIFSAR